MTKLWPYIDQAASDLIKQKVQPILDQYAMGIIQKLELKEVAFGNKAPQIMGVRLTPGLEDETVLEIKILWQTEKEGVTLSVDLPGPNYKVQLKNWHLEGTAKLIFKPLTGTIPGFGAVLVSLTEPPDFDFDLKFLGGDIGAVPGLEKMIDNSIRTALMDSLVWPSRSVVPMIPGGDFSFLELHPVGELDVELIEAKNIKNTDVLGKADPFVVLYVRQTKDKTKRSKSKNNTLKPVWNEKFKLEVEDPEYQKLTLRLMDDESVEKSEYIGTAQLSIKEFQPHHETELWCDVLEDPESHAPDQIRGSLHLKVTWNPYSREEIEAKRGHNETEKKIHEEQQILAATEKGEQQTAGDAPKQQGNITQHPTEHPREPGPTAELPSPSEPTK
jgi:Ca2+-dependent lipid-binding protein